MSKKTQEEKHVEFLKLLSSDIQQITMHENDTMRDVYRKFFDIMRKHGVKQEVRKIENTDVIVPSSDWDMAVTYFGEQIKDQFFAQFNQTNIPEDLKSSRLVVRI